VHCLQGVIVAFPWRESWGETQRECQWLVSRWR